MMGGMASAINGISEIKMAEGISQRLLMAKGIGPVNAVASNMNSSGTSGKR